VHTSRRVDFSNPAIGEAKVGSKMMAAKTESDFADARIAARMIQSRPKNAGKSDSVRPQM
jgi:hypothetical protein